MNIDQDITNLKKQIKSQWDKKLRKNFKVDIESLSFLIDQAKTIAEARTKEYQNRGHANKIEIDFKRGMLSELFSYVFLDLLKEEYKLSYNLVKPDFNLRQDWSRRHDPDLKSDKLNLHIKSFYTYDKPWSHSVNFQKNDIDQKTFSNKDFLILIGLNEDMNLIQFHYVCPILFLKNNNFFTKPVSKRFWEKKYAIYFNEKHSNRVNIDSKIHKPSVKFHEFIRSL